MRYTYDQPDYLDENGLRHLVDELRGLIEEIVNGNLNVSVYATKEDLSSYAKTEDIPSLEGYATKAYVDENIADVATGGEIDLSNYVTKDTVYTKEETDAMITEIDVITEDEIKALFETEGLATKEDVSTAIDSIPATDLSNYYTKDETYSKSEVDTLIANSGGSTDEGGTEEGGGETPTPTTGTSSISGNTTLKCGYTRTYTGSFLDSDGNAVSDVIGTWTLEGSASSGIDQEVTDNKIALYFEDDGLIGETVTLTFSDPNGNYTSSSIEIELADIF